MFYLLRKTTLFWLPGITVLILNRAYLLKAGLGRYPTPPAIP